MSTLRVLQVHNYHATHGGDEEVMSHERTMLEAAGHEVDEYGLASAEELELPPVRAAGKAIWNVAATRELGRRIKTFRPDVMHVHDPYPLLSPAVFRVARRLKVPSLVTQHAYRYTCVVADHIRDGRICEDCVGLRVKIPAIRHRCYHDSLGASGAMTASLALHRALGTFTRDVTRFVALTDFSADLLVREGIPAGKVVVKPNSVVDLGRAPAPAGAPYVFFAGRFLDTKGIRTVLAAWPQVGPGLDLVIAGDGPLRHLVEEAAGSDPRIRYLGWQEATAIPGLMGGAEAVLVPSQWYEGLPLVILRSLSVGTPLVVSDVPNLCEEIERDGTGFVFRTGSPESLAGVLNRLATDPWQARALRDRARAVYEERYTPERDLERLVSLYRSAILEVARSA